MGSQINEDGLGSLYDLLIKNNPSGLGAVLRSSENQWPRGSSSESSAKPAPLPLPQPGSGTTWTSRTPATAPSAAQVPSLCVYPLCPHAKDWSP